MAIRTDPAEGHAVRAAVVVGALPIIHVVAKPAVATRTGKSARKCQPGRGGPLASSHVYASDPCTMMRPYADEISKAPQSSQVLSSNEYL